MLRLLPYEATGRPLDAVRIMEIAHDLQHRADSIISAERDQPGTDRAQPTHQMLNLLGDALIATPNDLPRMATRKDTLG